MMKLLDLRLLTSDHAAGCFFLLLGVGVTYTHTYNFYCCEEFMMGWSKGKKILCNSSNLIAIIETISDIGKTVLINYKHENMQKNKIIKNAGEKKY